MTKHYDLFSTDHDNMAVRLQGAISLLSFSKSVLTAAASSATMYIYLECIIILTSQYISMSYCINMYTYCDCRLVCRQSGRIDMLSYLKTLRKDTRITSRRTRRNMSSISRHVTVYYSTVCIICLQGPMYVSSGTVGH